MAKRGRKIVIPVGSEGPTGDEIARFGHSAYAARGVTAQGNQFMLLEGELNIRLFVEGHETLTVSKFDLVRALLALMVDAPKDATFTYPVPL